MSKAAVRSRAASRRVQPESTRAARPVLTGRAAVLLLLGALLVYTLAVPVQSLMAQRADLSGRAAANDATRAQLAALTAQQQRLDDPAYVATLIRERLQYVRPGEIGYVVLGSREAPSAAAIKAASTSPWYERLLRSVRAVDGSGSVVDNPIVIRPDAPR